MYLVPLENFAQRRATQQVLSILYAIFQQYHVKNKLHLDMMMIMIMMSILYYANTRKWICYSASSPKQLSASRHVAPLPRQPVFALTPYCCVLSREATNSNCIVFGLTRPGLERTIDCIRGKHANHYTTDAGHVPSKKMSISLF